MRLSESLSDDVWQEDVPERSSLEELFWEEPVSLDVFVQDQKYLHNPPLSPKQYEFVQHLERIYLPETLDLMAIEFGGYWKQTQHLRMVHDVIAQWGKGGGKDHSVRIAHLRATYLLLCMNSPQRYFKVPDQDSIHLLNIAANATQANRAFFTPMTNVVKRGWFKDYADPKRDTIEYDKHIEAISGHSDAESQEGLNILFGVADEIDAFKAKDEMVGQGKKAREASTSAESILELLKTSASTRFPENYKRAIISFPRYLGSTIQRLTAEGKADNDLMKEKSKVYVSGPFPTWVVNPLRRREQFADDYRRDPSAAAAKYECRPSRSSDAYFRNPQLFRQAVTRETQPLNVTYQIAYADSAETGSRVKVWEPVFEFADDLQPVEGALYSIHADLALRGDRAGIAMSHVKRWVDRVDTLTDDETGMVTATSEVSLPVVKNDFTIAFTADSSARDEDGELMPREIQIRWARLLCFHLIRRGFTIVRFTFDQFQSADSMQTLERHGIATQRVSTDVNDNVWKAVMDVVSDNRLEMAYDDRLQIELESLSRLSNGKVDHPPGGSKDLADAFGASIVGALVVGGEEDADSKYVDTGESLFETGSYDSPFEGALPGGGLDVPMGMKEFSGGW